MELSQEQIRRPIGNLAVELPPRMPQAVADSLNKYQELSVAVNTKIAYRRQWARFVDWCVEHHLVMLPARQETVAGFLSALADDGFAYGTICQAKSAISVAHQAAAVAQGGSLENEDYYRVNPCDHILVRQVMGGIARKHGREQRQARPLLPADVAAMIKDASPRDRALLLVGWRGALRQSEIIELQLGDVEFSEWGMSLRIRKSKTDQKKRGHRVKILRSEHPETCTVTATLAWMHVLTEKYLAFGLEPGPSKRLFEISSEQSVTRIIKRMAFLGGLDPERISSHSMRAGFMTDAARRGVRLEDLMRHTRHRSVQVALRYIREASLEQNPTKDCSI